MAKKKKAKPGNIRPKKAAEERPNLFENICNRKKFNVLGKKQKGERKHGKARADAAEKVLVLGSAAFCDSP